MSGAVDPLGFLALEEVAADQIAGGEVLVRGDGNEGLAALIFTIGAVVAPADGGEGASEEPRHVLDEARFAAASGTFEEDGDLLLVGSSKDFDLVADGEVVGLLVDCVLLDLVAAIGLKLLGWSCGWAPAFLSLRRRRGCGGRNRDSLGTGSQGVNPRVPKLVDALLDLRDGSVGVDDDVGVVEPLLVGDLGTGCGRAPVPQ